MVQKKYQIKKNKNKIIINSNIAIPCFFGLISEETMSPFRLPRTVLLTPLKSQVHTVAAVALAVVVAGVVVVEGGGGHSDH